MANNNGATHQKTTVRTSRIPPQKVYDYIKKLEIDGYPRVRAYAEAIDPEIYNLTPEQISSKLDYFKRNYAGYDDIRETVLAEHSDWNMRKSAAIQNKALDLLSNLLDKANQIATDPEADAKELNMAVNTLKSIMPAFTAIGNKPSAESSKDKKTRAAGYIN